MQTTASTTDHAIQESKGTQCIKRDCKITSNRYEEPEEAEEADERCSKTIVMLFTPPRSITGRFENVRRTGEVLTFITA